MIKEPGETETTRRFRLGVAGESRSNADGTPRQSIINVCRLGDAVRLVPEPNNPHDPHAVAVIHPAGQIGYLSADNAARLGERIGKGRIIGAEINQISGPDGRKGVVLLVTEEKPQRGGKGA